MKTVSIKSIRKIQYDGPVYDLSFEGDPYFMVKSTSSKALNKECNSLIIIHNSPPDLDIDFQTGTDHETDDFLYKKYGRERVMSVGTFSKWNERGCLKDVVRAHRGPEATGTESDVAQITKEMPKFDKVEYNLAWWLENHAQSDDCSPLVQRWLTDSSNKVIIEQTLALQGQVRGFGKHAAGVVITPGPSWDYLPTNMIVSNKSIVSAYQEGDRSGKDLSYLGILKLDRLKVSTINIIMDCIKMVKDGEKIDLFDTIMNIDEQFDDQNLYKELMLGQNHGIFQFESPGMNALIRGLNVENFEEMAACNALYRPGPMGIGAHRQYVDNKRFPGQIEFPSDLIKPILEKTNGVLVFQEQIQFIAKEIAGMDLGEGDNLRRALDKAAKLIKKTNQGEELTQDEKESKNYKAYEEYWSKFVSGAEENGVPKEEVDKILLYLSDYLGYSFNKCLSENCEVTEKEKGKISLLKTRPGDMILGYNPDTKKNEWVPVKARHNNGKKKVYRIKTSSGKILECTLDHKIMTEQGMLPLKDIIEQKLSVKIN